MDGLESLLRSIGSLTDDAQLTRGILFVAGSLGAAWVTLRRIFAKPAALPAERYRIDAPANVEVTVKARDEKERFVIMEIPQPAGQHLSGEQLADERARQERDLRRREREARDNLSPAMRHVLDECGGNDKPCAR